MKQDILIIRTTTRSTRTKSSTTKAAKTTTTKAATFKTITRTTQTTVISKSTKRTTTATITSMTTKNTPSLMKTSIMKRTNQRKWGFPKDMSDGYAKQWIMIKKQECGDQSRLKDLLQATVSAARPQMATKVRYNQGSALTQHLVWQFT